MHLRFNLTWARVLRDIEADHCRIDANLKKCRRSTASGKPPAWGRRAKVVWRRPGQSVCDPTGSAGSLGVIIMLPAGSQAASECTDNTQRYTGAGRLSFLGYRKMSEDRTRPHDGLPVSVPVLQ